MTTQKGRKWVNEYTRRYPGNVGVHMVDRLNKLSDKELRDEIAINETEWQWIVDSRTGLSVKIDPKNKWQIEIDNDSKWHIKIDEKSQWRIKTDENSQWKPTEIILPSHKQPERQSPPAFGQFLVCLFVSLDRQSERLGDMEEIFSTVWVPKFGPHIAQLIYLSHALSCAARLIKGAAVVAFVDRLLNLLHRIH